MNSIYVSSIQDSIYVEPCHNLGVSGLASPVLRIVGMCHPSQFGKQFEAHLLRSVHAQPAKQNILASQASSSAKQPSTSTSIYVDL